MKKTAIITGASRGIGYAAAKKLGMDGCQVVLFATGEKERYKAAIDGLTQAGITWHYVRGSLDCREDRERLIRETVEKFGRIDILVNNAGVAPKERKDLLEMSEESFDRVLGINTKGTMFLTQLAAKQMIKQEQIFKSKGHIVNGFLFRRSFVYIQREYCFQKQRFPCLPHCLRTVWHRGILVNEVRPGSHCHRYDQCCYRKIRYNDQKWCISYWVREKRKTCRWIAPALTVYFIQQEMWM